MKESILKILDLNVHKHLTLDELKSQLDKKRGFDKALNELLEEGLVFCTKNSKYALTSSFNYYVGEVIKADGEQSSENSDIENDADLKVSRLSE